MWNAQRTKAGQLRFLAASSAGHLPQWHRQFFHSLTATGTGRPKTLQSAHPGLPCTSIHCSAPSLPPSLPCSLPVHHLVNNVDSHAAHGAQAAQRPLQHVCLLPIHVLSHIAAGDGLAKLWGWVEGWIDGKIQRA